MWSGSLLPSYGELFAAIKRGKLAPLSPSFAALATYERFDRKRFQNVVTFAHPREIKAAR